VNTSTKIAVLLGATAVVGIGVLSYLHHGYELVVPLELGDVVIDIGAGGFTSIGDFATLAARKVGEEGLVIAIEPNPTNVATLRHKTSNMNLTNLLVIQSAVWECQAQIPFYFSLDPTQGSFFSGRPHTTTEIVYTKTLDNIVSTLGITNIDFIKMDVEGAEIEVLKGAEQSLAIARKIVVAAYHTNRLDISPTAPWVQHFLESRGFCTKVTYPGLVHGWRE